MNTELTLTFEVLRNIEMSDYRFFGPPKPISNYKIAAGLLFERFGSRARRHCVFASHGLWSEIVLSTDVTGVILVTNDCISHLHKEGFLNRVAPRPPGLTSREKLFLNRDGARQVVTDWFASDSDNFQGIAAGAALEISTGKLRWP